MKGSRDTLKKWSAYLGIALLYMPNDLNWYWGNLVVYVDSYNYVYHPQSVNGAPWLVSLFVCFWGVALSVAAHLNKRMRTFHIAVLGSVIYDIGIVSTFGTIRQSMHLLNFTMGAVSGFGYGLIQAVVFLWIQDMTSSSNIALAYGMVSNCLNLGAIGLNAVITFYINPDNSIAELSFHGTKVFTEPSIVERVPNLFIILGICTSTFHFVGLFLVRISFLDVRRYANATMASKGDESSTKSYDEIKPIKTCKCNSIKGEFSCGCRGKDYKTYSDSQQQEKLIIPMENEQENVPLCDSVADNHNPNADSETVKSMSLKEAMKTKQFYLLILALLSADFCYLSVLNYYKIFGETTIDNDYFLTTIGTASSLAALLTRLLWGAFIDRYGIKTSAVLFIATISSLFLTYYVTVHLDDWMFAIWTASLSTMCTALYIIFPVASLHLFGKTYFSDIYGAIMATTILTNLVAPTVIKLTLQHFGWFGFFTGIGIGNFILLMLLIWGLPRN